jgi:2-polyprenyl-6-hydroxyphenyl methylase/3-demethylubiquinone-9 3-methyltransferase
MDVCLVVELLEHVSDWKSCINEFARVLRPKGVLLVTTTSCLCPIQQEFTLPLYSWYPSPLKRYCEKLSLTSKPWLANHATYPAVNWFSFYQLRRELNQLGFIKCMDRFDVLDTSAKGMPSKIVTALIRKIGVLRWLGHVATPGTLVLAVKRS